MVKEIVISNILQEQREQSREYISEAKKKWLSDRRFRVSESVVYKTNEQLFF